MVEPRRPVAVGAFPLPFGYLLMPVPADPALAAAVDEVRLGLLAGRLPTHWPEVLAGHAAAAAGDVDRARAVFAAGEDWTDRFNVFVLDPDAVDAVALRAQAGDLAVLVDLVGYVLGRHDHPPAVDGCDGELAALTLAARAADALARADADAALADLAAGVELARAPHPALAGVLLAAATQVARSRGDLAAAAAAGREGIALLTGTDLDVALAELHLELAGAHHDQAADRPDLLHRAVHHYHCVTQTVDAASAPELFAAAHAGLGAAYLTMPMVEASDQLRLGIALGSLRAALTVYRRETHPAAWSSVQLNLANALVYAPSTHREQNLVEAVELYEAVLRVRDRTADPLGRARVLANQGNALAHLGRFDDARPRLVEARFAFEEFHEYDAASSVRGLLDEIARATVAADPAGLVTTDAR